MGPTREEHPMSDVKTSVLEDTGTAHPQLAISGRRMACRAGVNRLTATYRFTVPIVGLIGVWWIWAALLDNSRIYPTPPDVFTEVVKIVTGDGPFGSTYTEAWATLSRVLVAFSLAYVIGTVTGVVAGRKKAVFDFSTSLVWIAFAVPSVVWVFIFLIVFGISDVVPVLALVVLLSAPVFIGTAEGVKAVSQDLIVMSDSYRVKPLNRFTGLYLPSILPYLLANARVSFALGMKIVIVAEVIGLPNGIGLLVRYWSDRLYMAPVVAWAIVMIAFGLIVDRFVFGYFERRAKRWSSDQANAAAT
jgi:ABC-type nitrate/sulfonate/bicarbonate transport system permease component